MTKYLTITALLLSLYPAQASEPQDDSLGTSPTKEITEIFVSNPDIGLIEEDLPLQIARHSVNSTAAEKPWNWGDVLTPSTDKVKEHEEKGAYQVVISHLPIINIGEGD
jgi:hypothetical protein